MRNQQIKHSGSHGTSEASLPTSGAKSALRDATTHELANEIAMRTKAVVVYAVDMGDEEPPALMFTDSFPDGAALGDVLRSLARFQETEGRDQAVYTFMDEGTARRFYAPEKREPVFAIFDENPGNPDGVQSHLMKHSFQDKAFLCHLLRKYIAGLEGKQPAVDVFAEDESATAPAQ